MIEGDHLRWQKMSVFCWSIKISPCCKQIYGPLIVSSGKSPIPRRSSRTDKEYGLITFFLFHTFVTQTLERSLGLIFDFVRK